MSVRRRVPVIHRISSRKRSGFFSSLMKRMNNLVSFRMYSSTAVQELKSLHTVGSVQPEQLFYI